MARRAPCPCQAECSRCCIRRRTCSLRRARRQCRRRSRRLKRVGQEQRGHMRCRRRRWRRDSRFRRGHVPTPMVARSVCASRGGTLDSHELVTSGVALHWALACETRRRTCSGRRCSSGREWSAGTASRTFGQGEAARAGQARAQRTHHARSRS